MIFGADGIKISLGIGIAAVELDLGELNNSKVSYAFGLYEIESARDECTVVLTYKIAGQVTHTEVRKIPDCDEEKEQEKEQKKLPPEGERPSERKGEVEANLPGELWDYGYWLLTMDVNRRSGTCNFQGLFTGSMIDQYSSYSGQITSVERYKESATVSFNLYNLEERYYQPVSGYPRMLVRPGYPRIRTSSDTRTIPVLNINDVLRWRYRFNFVDSALRINDIFLKGEKWQIQRWMRRSNKVQEELEDFYFTYPVEGRPDAYNYKYTYPKMDLQDYRITEKGFPTRKGINYNGGEKKDDPEDEDMDKRCCKMIEEIYDVLAPDELIDEGFSAPNRLISMEGKGYYLATNYLKIFEFLVRMGDHLGIHPVKAEISDANLLKAGKQALNTKTVNAHAAIKQILENSYKNDTNNEAILRILGAFGIALSQITRITTEATKSIRDIMVFLGMPLKDKSFKITMPFNIQALYKNKVTKKRKGKKVEKVTEKVLNTEEKLETLLPKFVQSSTQTFRYEGYNDDEPTLIEALNQNDISNIEQIIEK
ncbi:hypothetical protein [Okeania sp. KiyG1]|uniref:hypothetical protein n=1 Tax=Okeania sp. KiyG1 TaxID=2720165 RepID=UPI001920B7F4|nr:hypothetical protein [Okeania sp. KiyG1]